MDRLHSYGKSRNFSKQTVNGAQTVSCSLDEIVQSAVKLLVVQSAVKL
jgi:aminoglycoside N3'-acetyltransferase